MYISLDQYRAGLFDLLHQAERCRTKDEYGMVRAEFNGLMSALVRQTEDEDEEKRDFEELAEVYQACFDMTAIAKFDSGIL